MARYRFESKLRERAEQFSRQLAEAGFRAVIVEDSFRDYSVKVSVSAAGKELGHLIIYYKPKTDTFSIGTHELKDKSVAAVLEDCWHGVGAGGGSTGYEIYVDGSYSGGVTGYGAVILKDGQVVAELSGAVDAAEVNGTYQVAGELAAVRESLKWCRSHSVAEASIYFDYLGIEKWATGRWRAGQRLTQEYARFVRDCGVEIHWHKVTAHTGNRWNERADALARKGAGSAARPAAAEDLLDELLEKTDAWIEFLSIKGIEASFDRIYNEQYARIAIISEDQPVGTFDLYHTRKKRFSPYLHNFRDGELKARIESLWREFAATLVRAS